MLDFPQLCKNPARSFVCLVQAVLFVGLLLISTSCVSDSIAERNLQLLAEAFKDVRPNQVRMTGEPYRPWIETRGGSDVHENDPALRLAELEILKAASENENAESLLPLGRFYLARNDHKRAAEALNRAVAVSGDNAKLYADLGAAYLNSVKGRPSNGQELRSVVLSIEYLARAIELDPNLPEPRFNRALALGKLGLRSQTTRAWNEYLAIDSSSGWSAEARSLLTEIEVARSALGSPAERIAEFFAAIKDGHNEKAFELLSVNREMITESLIPQKLTFMLCEAEPGTQAYDDLFETFRTAGELEFKETGDPFWNDAVGFYQRSFGSKRDDLCQAHSLLRTGYFKTLANQHGSAELDFAEATNLYRNSGSLTDALIGEYWLGYIEQQSGLIKNSEKRLLKGQKEAEEKGYLWITSQFLAWLANVDGNKDSPATRIEKTEIALSLAERLKDNYQKLRCLDILANTYVALGTSGLAVNQISVSLPLTEVRFTSPRQRWRTLSFAAETIAGMGGNSAAEAILNEALEHNRTDLKENSFEYFVNIQIAQLAGQRGNFNEAFRSIEASRQTLSNFDEKTGPRHAAYLDLINAHSLRMAGNCEDAFTLYKSANLFHERSESELDRFDGRRGQLFCHISNNDHPEVQALVPIVLLDMDRYRNQIRSESLRNSFFGNAQQVFDALIGYESKLGNADAAFEYAEMSRARSLLDMVSSGFDLAEKETAREVRLKSSAAKPLDLATIRNSLPHSAQIVMYSVLEEQLIVWVLTSSSAEMRKVAVTRKRLEDLTNEFTASLSRPGTASLTADELSNALIGSIRDLIDPAKTLVVIPDKSLAKVPFAALPGLNERQFLIEEFAIQYAPSSTLFINASSNAQNGSVKNEKFLGIGDPNFDKQTFPSLSSLPDAVGEVTKIADLYRDADLLIGKDATAEMMREQARDANVLHFAGHYLYGTGSPLDSGFLVAGEDKNSLLSSYDLVGSLDHKIKLAILSACTTGSEDFIVGEGMIGAARSLIAAGVPHVVATHWEIDSAVSSRLMFSFHKNRKLENMSTSGALRSAQLELINDPDQTTRDPYYWAAFFVIGGIE